MKRYLLCLLLLGLPSLGCSTDAPPEPPPNYYRLSLKCSLPGPFRVDGGIDPVRSVVIDSTGEFPADWYTVYRVATPDRLGVALFLVRDTVVEVRP